MWSHYADGYSGAVIEVDESHEFFTGYFEVEYRQNRPKKDIGSYLASDEPIPIAELCVKSKEWEYEAEVRVVRNLVDCRCVCKDDGRGYPAYVMDFPTECIKSVTLGERMPIPHTTGGLGKGEEHGHLVVPSCSIQLGLWFQKRADKARRYEKSKR